MGAREGIFFLLVLVVSSACVGARNLVTSDVSVVQINIEKPKVEVAASDANVKDKRVCSLCEQFTSQALTYLNENKTQTEVMDHLHVACSRLLSFKQECLTLVNYYAPLFFLEITTVQPGDFCQKMNLCDEQFPPNSCKMCHAAVEEIMAKLEDPDTQLEIIEVLLKVCNADKRNAKKCKKLVFEFGPLALANAEQFLASTDVCTTIHACKGSDEASSSLKRAFLSDS